MEKKKKKQKRSQFGMPIGKLLNKQISQPTPAQVELSECAAKYAIAVVDPWNASARGACVPYPPARPSRKVTTFTRGLMTVGSNGWGYVAVSPTLQGDFASIWYSGLTYPGFVFNATMAPTGGVTALAQSNVPYTRAELTTENPAYFTTQVQGRVVSCSLSLRYVGTELNRGGRVLCFASPDHQNINNMSASDLGARAETDYSTPSYDRDKCWTVSYGLNDEELSYTNIDPTDAATTDTIKAAYPYSRGQPCTSNALDASYGCPVLGALVNGVVGNTFEFEVVQHLEYIGVLAESALTESSVDSVGLSTVQTALARTNVAKTSNPSMPLKKVFRQELVKVSKEVGKQAVLKGGAMLMTMLL